MKKLIRFLKAILELFLSWRALRKDSGLSIRELEDLDAATQVHLDQWKEANRPRAPHERDNWEARCKAKEREIRAQLRREQNA